MILIAASAIIFTGCKKYADGPSISTLSITKYLSNNWKVVKATASDGDDVTSNFNEYSIEIKKDGTYIEINNSHTDTGTWTLDGTKDNIMFTEGSNTHRCLILRLKNKELWLKETDSYPTEIHYEPKN